MSFLSLLISSCAAAPISERGFQAPPESVRRALRKALEGYPELREEGGRIVTGWGAATPTGREQGPLLGQEYRTRLCHEVTVNGSSLSVSSRAERRAPAGPRSLRWERVDAAPFREALLAAVEKELEDSK